METTINDKTIEVSLEKAGKIAALNERLQLAKELKLLAEIRLYESDIQILEKNINYEEVTVGQAESLLCKSQNVFCKPFYPFGDSKHKGRSCERFWPHMYVEKQRLSRTSVCVSNTGYMYNGKHINRANIPFPVMCLMKDAVSKGFSVFEVWEPMPFGAEKPIDPWLIGILGDKYFKIADWR